MLQAFTEPRVGGLECFLIHLAQPLQSWGDRRAEKFVAQQSLLVMSLTERIHHIHWVGEWASRGSDLTDGRYWINQVDLTSAKIVPIMPHISAAMIVAMILATISVMMF